MMMVSQSPVTQLSGVKDASTDLDSKRELIRQQRRQLPIFIAQRELVKEVMDNDSLVIVGETGSGKTTQLPQFLRVAGFCKKGTIGITQPRRVAAMTISESRGDWCSVGSGGRLLHPV